MAARMHPFPRKGMAMLKITNSGTVDEERWILSGQLAGPWVAELRSNWEQVRNGSRGRRYVIDLSEVTRIDASGEGLLSELKDEGAEFVASGPYTKYLLENLKTKKQRGFRA
jgi:ABC-type transporter Mla MlaB component